MDIETQLSLREFSDYFQDLDADREYIEGRLRAIKNSGIGSC